MYREYYRNKEAEPGHKLVNGHNWTTLISRVQLLQTQKGWIQNVDQTIFVEEIFLYIWVTWLYAIRHIWYTQLKSYHTKKLLRLNFQDARLNFVYFQQTQPVANSQSKPENRYPT